MMRPYTYLLLGTLLSGCSSPSPALQGLTPACVAYQHMMTAPLPPYQHRQLQVQCERSRAVRLVESEVD